MLSSNEHIGFSKLHYYTPKGFKSLLIYFNTIWKQMETNGCLEL